jgi:hypothetical protein
LPAARVGRAMVSNRDIFKVTLALPLLLLLCFCLFCFFCKKTKTKLGKRQKAAGKSEMKKISGFISIFNNKTRYLQLK